jgi:hypothetical protein
VRACEPESLQSCIDSTMARAQVSHHVEDQASYCGKEQSGQLADPDLAQNLYPHLVVDPNHWNSQIVTGEANRATLPKYVPSKGSMGVTLQKVGYVGELVLQSVEAHPVTSAAQDACSFRE